MIAQHIVVVSGTVQIFTAVMLGWALAFHDSGGLCAAIFRDKRRLLQTHLDDILMGTLQLAVAATFDDLKPLIAGLLIIGSWTNAKIFLLLSVTDNAASNWRLFRPLTHLSFAVLTVAYGSLVYIAAAGLR